MYRWNTRNDPYDGTWEPDDTGSDGLTAAKALVSMGAADSYRHAFDVQSVLSALQLGPVLIGTVWRQDMFHPAEDGVVTATGAVVGGHEYLAVGYDPDVNEVVFANSWGLGWGMDGYFSMAVPTLAALLAEDGDATIPHALVAAPPAPPGPADPGRSVLLDADVAAHVALLAARKGITPDQWVNRRLRKYFG